jgi:flavin-dependent dehydrogenase
MHDRLKHIVIGGGPGGAMLGLRLAEAGREVMILEKERHACDKVCGEFLSREAIGYLRQAGIEPCSLGASTITSVRLTSGRRSVESRLPFTALSLSRRVMDEALLNKAMEAGCDVLRGNVAEKLERDKDGWAVRLRDGKRILADTAFLATGKHDLSSWERRGGTQTDLVGFKMYWKLAPSQIEALRGLMELLLFRDGYGGLSLVEGGTANLCFVLRKRRLRALGGWTEVLAAIREELPILRERLADATAHWAKPLAISPIPYGYQSNAAEGLWRLGDQAAVIPSFTGDGMSIALHSGALAAEMFLAGRSAEEYAHRLGDHLQAGMQFASLLSRSMVTAGGRFIAPFVFSLVPKAMWRIASHTRIPDRALLKDGRMVSSTSPGALRVT